MHPNEFRLHYATKSGLTILEPFPMLQEKCVASQEFAPPERTTLAKEMVGRFGPEGKRMASGFIGNEVPRKGLRVRVPCPPLSGQLLEHLTAQVIESRLGGSPANQTAVAW